MARHSLLSLVFGLVVIGQTALATPFPGAIVIAHRGDSAAYPENTLTALRAAAELRVAGAEFDVQMTRDGELVLFHDKDLLRHSNFATVFPDRKPEDATVRNMTFAELSRLDVGSWKAPGFRGERIPTLRAALETLRGRCVPVIELKEADIGRQTAELVQELDMEAEVIAISFQAQAIHDFREVLSDTATGLNIGRSEIESSVEKARLHAQIARESGANALIVHESHVDAEYVGALHARGLSVWSYTINERSVMEEKLAYGLDGVITDVPRRALEAVAGLPAQALEGANRRPDVVARPERLGKRVLLRAGEIPVESLARFLSDYSGLPLLYGGDGTGLRERRVLVAADVASADYEIVKALLTANGMLLEERALPGGRRILNLDAGTRSGGAGPGPHARPVVVVGGGERATSTLAGTAPSESSRTDEVIEFSGLVLAEVPAALRAHTELQKGWGVLLVEVRPEARRRAEFQLLQAFDIVTGVDSKPVDGPHEFVKAIEARAERRVAPGTNLQRYRVVRKGQTRILALR